MAHKVSAGGSYRLDRRYPLPVGRLAIATGATTKGAFGNVVSCLDRLVERGRLDVLGALKRHQVSVAQVLDADRGDQLDALLASLTPSPEQKPLWASVEAWLGEAKDRGPTVKRYGVSFLKLQRSGVLPADAPVSALAGVDWKALAQRWEGSGSDWNHCRRAVSHFLAEHLGDVYHPLRRDVVKRIPKKREVERVPDLDVDTFWRIVNAAPEFVRPSFVCLVALGLRGIGKEYLGLTPEHLHPITQSVSIPGTKTEGSATVLKVAPELWPWVVRAVPSPVGDKALRRYWKEAKAAAGVDADLRPYDLRHCHGQWLSDAGVPEARIQVGLRHATAITTRRYTKQRDKGQNAAALARALFGEAVNG